MTVVLCKCGCGLPAPIATKTDSSNGHVKGEPRPFRHGHNMLLPRIQTVAQLKQMTNESSAGCWVWSGRLSSGGYALYGTQYVHRLVMPLLGEVIPAGMYIDHQCRVKACVNPNHLRIVSPRTNAIENNDSWAAVNARKTECPKCGGPYEVTRKGARSCRPCSNAHRRAQKLRRKKC